MIAIILAAGASRRLLPYTADRPKCLIEINGGTILDQQLNILGSFGITEVVIVVGYRQEHVRSAIASRWEDFDVTFVENPMYASTDTIYSFWLARRHLENDFLHLNGDVVTHPEVVKRLLNSAHDSCLAIDRKTCGDEEVKVMVDGLGRITRIGKELDTDSSVGEFVGIGKHAASGNRLFIREIAEQVAAGNLHHFFEAALDSVVQTYPYYEVDISDLPCIEIDSPEDLEDAKRSVWPQIKRRIGGS